MRVSVPIYLNVYVYDIKNPVEVQNGEDAQLEEVGPFVFYETREKEIDSMNQTNIFYHDLKTFYFDAQKSKYPLEMEVTVVNVPMIVSLLYSFFNRNEREEDRFLFSLFLLL